MLGNKTALLLCVAILSISWIQATPDLLPGGIQSDLPIQIVRRSAQPDLKFSFPSSSDLMTGGIYSPDQLDRLREHIMNPQGREPQRFSPNLYRSEGSSVTVHHIEPTMCACSQAWDKFIPFCIVCVGIIATFICIKTITLVVKAIINVWGILFHRDRSEERHTKSNLLASGTDLNAIAVVEKGMGEK